jgi:hypothetical protein
MILPYSSPPISVVAVYTITLMIARVAIQMFQFC